jgi:hypothetical protein
MGECTKTRHTHVSTAEVRRERSNLRELCTPVISDSDSG